MRLYYRDPTLAGVRFRSPELLVVDLTGHFQRLLVDSIWGYRTDEHKLVRSYNHNEYEVIRQEGLVIYRTQEWGGDVLANAYYFSLTLVPFMLWINAFVSMYSVKMGA